MINGFRARLLGSTLLVGAVTIAGSASAQTVPATPTTIQDSKAASDPAAPNPVDTASSSDIVVTGSLIRNPNLVSASPVASISSDEVQLRGVQSAEQLLRTLPGSVPGVGSAVNNGQGGVSTVNLRGLGSQRNLVLLDGQRIVPSGSAGSVDLNSIPLALIERTDVLTGGASTTYGADAVTGVVNFITKRDFAGIDASISNQITERGDGNYFRADLTVGANFDDNRGNVVLGIGYQNSQAVFQGSPRDYSQFSLNSLSGLSSGSSATSVPTTISFDNGSTLQVNPTSDTLVTPYAPFNFNPYNIFQTPFKRYNIYGSAHYDVSDSLEIYSRGMYSKTTVATIIAPSGIFGDALTVPANNPYLPANVRTQICAAENIAAALCTPTSTTALPLPAVYRRSVELGPRLGTYTTQMFDYTAGGRLKLSNHLSLDVGGNYGETDQVLLNSGYVLRTNLQQALNANNTTTCTVNTNGCVPLNLFGQAGSITAAQAAFVSGVSFVEVKTSLLQAHGIFTGDFGFTSPYADSPVAFAVGGEYRKYGYNRQPDQNAAIPGQLGGAGGAVTAFSGGYNVKEGFGELNAPLISGRPFFESLVAEAGVRYSSYHVNAAGSPSFNATTYKGDLTWAPINAIKFRGNYQRAVRAPNIAELFTPSSTGLTNLNVDPCAGAAPLTNANLAAICIAQGAPAGSIGAIQNPSAGQPNETGGGNPNIKPEIADTFTLGAVIEPKAYVPGLTISVDYYNIHVNNAITAATPADIIAACFGNITAASATSAACTTIRRSTINGRLSGSSATIPGLPEPLTNNGRLVTDGIDLTANYVHNFGMAKLNLNFNGNWTDHAQFAASPSSYNRECVGYYSTNCGFSGSIQPKFTWNQRTTVSFDRIDLSALWRHIDSVAYEGTASDYLARGFTAANHLLFNGVVTGTGPLVGQSYNFNKIPAYNYFDLSMRVRVASNYEFVFTATNVTDKQPPVVGSTTGSTAFNSGNTYPSTYDALGRTFNVSARVTF